MRPAPPYTPTSSAPEAWTRLALVLPSRKKGPVMPPSETEPKAQYTDPILDKSVRFQKFRRRLIKELPRRPNDRASLTLLQSKENTDLLIIYLCWRFRQIGVRPRQVVGKSTLLVDAVFAKLKSKLDAFINAAEQGSDLTPYLSLRALREGFVSTTQSHRTDWDDKDFLLNVMGFHHFHLGLQREPKGHMKRTKEVLFGHVSRDKLEILGLFDHTVFDHTKGNQMTPERAKIWSVYEAWCHSKAANDDAPAIIVSSITLAGTPMVVTVEAIKHLDLIRRIDPQLDDLNYAINTLYGGAPPPKQMKLQWHYNHLDLGILNVPTGDFFVLRPGPN